MKRYHEEKHIILRRIKTAQIMVSHEYGEWSDANFKPSRWRKTHTGCNKASCYMCHPEKFPKRILTRKEQQAKNDDRNHGW